MNRFWSHFLFFASILSAVAPLDAAGPAPSVPVVSFEARGVVVSALVPGEAVAVLGVNLVREHGVARSARIARLLPADSSGTARLLLDAPINDFSRFAIVGLESGRWVVASPPESPLRGRTEGFEELRPGHAGLADLLVSRRANVEILLVSPGHGAWVASGGDGHAADIDGVSDGKASIPLDALRALDPSFQTLRVLRPRDVVIVIDPSSFDFGVQEVNP